MLYCKCPRCGMVSHLYLSISRYEWYRRFFPTHDPRQPAPAVCARCWTRENGLEVLPEAKNALAQVLPAFPSQGSDIASAR